MIDIEIHCKITKKDDGFGSTFQSANNSAALVLHWLVEFWEQANIRLVYQIDCIHWRIPKPSSIINSIRMNNLYIFCFPCSEVLTFDSFILREFAFGAPEHTKSLLALFLFVCINVTTCFNLLGNFSLWAFNDKAVPLFHICE